MTKRQIKPKIPNPGSDQALDLGCTCPVLDNGHGIGVWDEKLGTHVFWQTRGCPIHHARSKV